MPHRDPIATFQVVTGQVPYDYQRVLGDRRRVFDEVQLMGPARTTSAPLAGPRAAFGATAPDTRDELVGVPIAELEQATRERWILDHVDGVWVRGPRRVVPGSSNAPPGRHLEPTGCALLRNPRGPMRPRPLQARSGSVSGPRRTTQLGCR